VAALFGDDRTWALQAGSVGASALQAGSVGPSALSSAALPTMFNLDGSISSPTVLSGTWQFVGPNLKVTAVPGQTVIASLSAGIGSSGGATADFDICVDTGGGPVPVGGGIFGVTVDTPMRIYSDSETWNTPGTYKVGFCASGIGTFNVTDFVNGYVMIGLGN
jgi:hypothetical protein